MLVQETDHHEKIKQQVEESKEKVRKMLVAPGEKSSQKLSLIDAIQRLGVAYHLENEIQEILQQLHKTFHDGADREDDDDDLCTVALRFRLLRQHGYSISCGAFFVFLGKCLFLFIGFKQASRLSFPFGSYILMVPLSEKIFKVIKYILKYEFEFHNENLYA